MNLLSFGNASNPALERAPLRPTFAALLLGVGVLSMWAWFYLPGSLDPDAMRKDPSASNAAPAMTLASAVGVAAEKSTPGSLAPHHPLAPSVFDPFAGMPPTPVQPAPPVQVQAPVAPSVPEPPRPPPLNYRFLGRMVDPAGQVVTLLMRADQVVPIVVGQQLDEGYLVERIDDTAVHLDYPPLAVKASIPVPPPSGDAQTITPARR